MTYTDTVTRNEVADLLALDNTTSARGFIAGNIIEAAGVQRLDPGENKAIAYNRAEVLAAVARVRGQTLAQAAPQDPTFAPRLEAFAVHPGDFGSRIKVLDGEYGVGNRDLRATTLARFRRSWDPVEAAGDTIKLVEVGDGTYLIADGQHRVKYVSDELGRPFTFSAMIHPQAVLADVARLEAAVRSPNTSAPMSTSDRLRVSAPRSYWPDALAAHGAHLTYSKGAGMTYGGAIQAIIGMIGSERAGRVTAPSHSPAVGKRRSDYAQELWLTDDAALIDRYAPLIARWDTIARRVCDDNGLRLFSAPYAQVGALLLAQNPRLTDEGVVTRLCAVRGDLRGDLIAASRSTGSNATSVITRLLLQVMNYRRNQNLITLFGQTGREL